MEGTKHFAQRAPESERADHENRRVSLLDGCRLMFATMVRNAKSDVQYGGSDEAAAAAEFLDELREYFADRPGVLGCQRGKIDKAADHGDQPRRKHRRVNHDD